VTLNGPPPDAWPTITSTPPPPNPPAANDHRSTTSPGFDWGTPCSEYMRDALDVLYEEGAETPRMMAIGLHCRLAGRPGRFAALRRFVDHVQHHDRVWLCRGVDIARHWHREHRALAADAPVVA